MKKALEFFGLYYPILLAFVSFLYSVSLWFSGMKLEGIFVGIWVPSILAASVAIRQRRNDSMRIRASKLAQEYYKTKKVKSKKR